jgi:hypothetical protein
MTEWLSNNVAVVLSVIAHGAASIWFASKMNTTVTMGFKNLTDSILRIDKELEKRDRDAKDANSAMWKRIDEVRDRVAHLEGHNNGQTH